MAQPTYFSKFRLKVKCNYVRLTMGYLITIADIKIMPGGYLLVYS